MTIKELENKTGMARANIRYYENEGLLHPKRLDNGYRDYSEEDARTLEKIKLLRQIGLDIDTIRKVQSEALTLE
ncbi:MAG: MerR family transcriptional regulator, partial [Oscillospiraceae bacterium]|nr:MerR family transcriptional regulator [Oscillospiraceae bacterium]